jgi:hypothetical protein
MKYLHYFSLLFWVIFACQNPEIKLNPDPMRKVINLLKKLDLTSIPKQRCGTVTLFYGYGSDFSQILVPVPVPTFEKLRFRFQLHIKTIKSEFFQKNVEFFLPFYIVSCFTRKKLINFNKFNKFIVKCE